MALFVRLFDLAAELSFASPAYPISGMILSSLPLRAQNFTLFKTI